MNKTTINKFMNHPDRDEIISKIVIGIPPKDISEFLQNKYTNVHESKFLISESMIKNFRDNYLDIYNYIQQDIAKSKTALANNAEEKLMLSIKNNPTYKNRMLELAGKELDIRQIITNLCVAIEGRLGQVFDSIQENPKEVNPRIDRVLIEYANTLGDILEKYYKFTEVPATQTVQHNVTLQVVDQHITVFHDVIREVLSQMDLETSLYFMEVFNEKMSKLKQASDTKELPTTETRLAEAKLLNETISKKING